MGFVIETPPPHHFHWNSETKCRAEKTTMQDPHPSVSSGNTLTGIREKKIVHPSHEGSLFFEFLIEIHTSEDIVGTQDGEYIVGDFVHIDLLGPSSSSEGFHPCCNDTQHIHL